MTVLMRGTAPISVTALALHQQPANYPMVEDDATILLWYPATEAVIEPSWNWPFARKDMEVYWTKGYEIAVNSSQLAERFTNDDAQRVITARPLTSPDADSLEYLKSVIAGQVSDRGSLSSLDTNVTVVQILVSARESAKTGRTVVLGPIPSQASRRR